MVDLSQTDSHALDRGRPALVEALWYFVAQPLVASRMIFSPAIRVAILRLFGAKIGRGVVMAKPGLTVKFPWRLSIGDFCWFGAGVVIDNLSPVTIGSNVVVSNEVYFCTDNHDYSDPRMRLFHKPITLEDGSWAAVRCLLCPGVTLGAGAVASAGSVVLKNIPPYEIHAGNPARFVRRRSFR